MADPRDAIAAIPQDWSPDRQRAERQRIRAQYWADMIGNRDVVVVGPWRLVTGPTVVSPTPSGGWMVEIVGMQMYRNNTPLLPAIRQRQQLINPPLDDATVADPLPRLLVYLREQMRL